MLVGIQDEILRLHAKGLLAPLLVDKTTKRNIIWATDAYRALGFPYERTQEILPALITGEHSDVIKTRARKEMEQQSERTRRHAEVFTPLAVCRQMIGDADAGRCAVRARQFPAPQKVAALCRCAAAGDHLRRGALSRAPL